MPWILEVQKHQSDLEIARNHGGKFEHIGYMRCIFQTKQQACDYYDKYNPHMRSLNAHGNWYSDWDPQTELRYIVRKHHGEMMKIKPFNPNDETQVI